MNLTRRFFETITVKTWSDLARLEGRFSRQTNQWIFRGHTDAAWKLETTLERQLRGIRPKQGSVSTLEGGLLRRFKRQAHHHLDDVPEPNSWLEWLALMQHHGAPTRLLDFTYSFFVGLYFAIEEGDGPYALWAMDSDYLRVQAEAAVGSETWQRVVLDPNLQEPATFEALFVRSRERRLPLVLPVNPYRFNERLAIQQGIFLCPGDVTRGFESNLTEMLNSTKRRDRIIKCVIPLNRTNRREVIRHLYRMNVTRASLFPSLDGFARSLRWSMLAFPAMLVADATWPKDRSLRHQLV